MVRKILRRSAPQNDRERGRAAPQNDSGGERRASERQLPSLVILSPSPLVILSEAKNLFSCLKDMVRKILRSEAPQNDRERGNARLQMTVSLSF